MRHRNPTDPAPAPGARRPRQTLPRAAAATVLLALLVTLLAAPPAAARHEEGDRVEVTGLVTDPGGEPLPGVRVALEASRAVFSLRKFGRELRNTRRAAAVTGERGEFTLEWPWDRYFNHYELVVGVPVRTAGGERFEVLERREVTRRLQRNDPMVITIAVERADFVRTLQAFVASVDSDDERRIYQQMGKPDKVEERGAVRSWWYFDQGRMVRFRDGELVEMETFDPVEKL